MAMKTCGSLAELEDGHQAINRDLYHHCKDSNCGMDDHHPKTMSIDHGKYMLLLDCGHLMRQAVLWNQKSTLPGCGLMAEEDFFYYEQWGYPLVN